MSNEPSTTASATNFTPFTSVEAGGNDTLPDMSSRVARVAAPLRERVFEVLQQEIVEMRLLPGQRLVERELIERIGVSRTTIREALRQLASEGLVTSIPQKGMIVAMLSVKEAVEVYQVRGVLEGIMARQFAEKATDEQVRELELAFVRMEERYAASQDPRELLKTKSELYAVIFDGADNATVRSILEGFQARIAVMRTATISAPDRATQSLEEIRAIVDAITRRDPAAAERASTNHVERAAETLFASPRLTQFLEQPENG